MDSAVWNRPNPLDPALFFFILTISNHIALVIRNHTYDTKQKLCTGFAQYGPHTNKLPAVFLSLPSSVAIGVAVTRAEPTATLVIDAYFEHLEISSTKVAAAK